MKIQARIDRMVNKGNVKAIASVSLDGMFVVKNLKIMDGKKGMFVSMPQESYPDRDGNTKYSNTFFALTNSARMLLQETVLDAYKLSLDPSYIPKQSYESSNSYQQDSPPILCIPAGTISQPELGGRIIHGHELLREDDILNLKRYISLLLAVMLFIGMIPYAQATEVSAAEETVASTEPAMDSTSPTEPTNPPADEAPDGNDIAAYASTQKSILLFDYTDNGDYTTRLNSQVACTYKLNGTGATKTAYVKNLGWHFARYNNTPYPDDPLYCIEPWRNYGASTSGNSVDRDITLDGSGSTTGSTLPIRR